MIEIVDLDQELNVVCRASQFGVEKVGSSKFNSCDTVSQVGFDSSRDVNLARHIAYVYFLDTLPKRTECEVYRTVAA